MSTNQNIFKLMHMIELFSNEVIIRWSKSFSRNIGISPILVLAHLQKHGPKKHKDLAKFLGYTPGALTNIANRLIEQGLAERKYDEEDRRSIFLEITDEGCKALKEAQEKGQELRMEIFQTLDCQEVEQLIHIHEKLLKYFQENNAKKN